VCQEAAQIDLIKSFFPIQPSGGLKGEEKLRYFQLTSGWLDLNEFLYLKGPRDSELLF